jgi:hypothetical protein
MPIDVNAFARLGAQARLAELQQELSDIHAAFPELRDLISGSERPKAKSAKIATDMQPAKPGRKSSGWTEAQRAAVGLRMKKYWAAKRKAAAAPTDATASASKPAAAQTRTMSAEARARISAAQKKRWAAHRSAKKG